MLSVRWRKDRFGPSLVWVRYTKTQRTLSTGINTRFTREVGGRRQHAYPASIFRPFDDPNLIEALIGIEKRAADIRREVAEWTSILTSLKTIRDIHQRHA